MNISSSILQIHKKDNVGIVANLHGLKAKTILENGVVLQEYTPLGHKIALKELRKGAAIIRYGEIIGYTKQTLKAGAWIKEQIIEMPQPPSLQNIPIRSSKHLTLPPLEGYTFQGYRNKDGSVGTKNILGISTSVQCVAGLAQYVVKKVKEALLFKYPNVDDVIALNHTYGCGVAINAPAAMIPIRTIKNLALNPNLGGETMVIGLGCEKLQPERITSEGSIIYMQDEAFHGFEAMVEGALMLVEKHLKKLNERKRETCPASDLVIGVQCGGSDAFSGITANPVVGFAADLIVRAGGSVMFSEVTEVRDAVHLLVPRAVNKEVAQKFLDEMQWYDDYLKQGQTDRSANTSPGNKKGGLSNIVEKALGSIVKSGNAPIVDVLSPGERIRKKGLIFAATPAGDFVCGTLQLASGMNLGVFTTGRGTPYGLAMAPIIKIGTNSHLSNRWFDLIDLDAGTIATGKKTIEEVGWELFHMILEVASGKRVVACDKLGLHNDLVLFNPGPLT